MSKTLFIALVCLMLQTLCLPVFADQYDECLDGCKQIPAPCIEQARLSAGNIQEEQDLIASCGQKKNDCIQACKDAEVPPPAPSPEQSPEQSPEKQQQSPSPPQPVNEMLNEIKTYEFK